MGADVYEVDDFEEAVELCHSKGWTDGLPVIPPTKDRVARFLDTVDLAPDHQIGFYSLRNRPVTVEKVAINAVMAGCRPEYFPAVVALAECMLDPALEVHTASSSTGSLCLGYVANGPMRNELGMNYNGNVLGPGNRANATLGRTMRMIQTNVFGSVAGAGGIGQGGRPILDRATMGHPARYNSFHIVENEELFPELTPLHVQRGFAKDDSVVTAFSLIGHIMLSNHFEKTPEDWLDSVAHYLVGAGRLADCGFGILMVPPEPAKMFVDAGWTKEDISRELFERAGRSLEWVKENGWKNGGRFERGAKVEPGDADIPLNVAGSPEEIAVVVTGGPAGNFPLYVQTYSGNVQMVSRKVAPLRHPRPAGADDGAAIDEAITPVRRQLQADGYDIALSRIAPNSLHFTLTAGADACAECLVPSSMMELYIRRTLTALPAWRDAEIELRYPVAAH